MENQTQNNQIINDDSPKIKIMGVRLTLRNNFETIFGIVCVYLFLSGMGIFDFAVDKTLFDKLFSWQVILITVPFLLWIVSLACLVFKKYNPAIIFGSFSRLAVYGWVTSIFLYLSTLPVRGNMTDIRQIIVSVCLILLTIIIVFLTLKKKRDLDIYNISFNDYWYKYSAIGLIFYFALYFGWQFIS